jgi:Uncharacterized NAD(FAD)-dependent dehydrogenases
MTKTAVIIGGGISGIFVMKDLQEKSIATKEDIKIVLLKREDTGWVSVCGLPYALRGWYEIDKVVINKPEFFSEQGVDFRTKTEVERINTDDKTLKLKTGETLKYDYLVIATGRKPALPEMIEKSTMKNIFTLSTMEDAYNIEAAFKSGEVKNALVRGRGIIALQAAAAAAANHIKTTVLAGPPSLLPGGLDPDMGDMLKEWMQKQGIEFILENQPISGLKEDGGRVSSVLMAQEVRRRFLRRW